ncbi:MAG: HEAT repeat domain-containing protein [Leptospiraceae bacterium]|nr:HEAT repeat domain-containing protein [Leptospiraceae bacterium]
MNVIIRLIIIIIAINCGPPRPTSDKQEPKFNQEMNIPTETLVNNLNSIEWNIRAEAAIALGSRGYKNAIPKLKNLLVEDKNPIVKASVATALGELKDTSSTIEIGKLFSNPEIAKDSLIDALSRMGDSRGAIYVIPFLDSEIHTERLQAVEALVNMRAASSSKEIIARANKNTDIDKAKTYAMVIGKLALKDGENYLLNLIQKAETGPTLAATILALGRIKSKKASPLLPRFISGDFDKGRENSVEALIMIQDKSILPIVFNDIENTNSEIKYLAAKVITGIPDKSSGEKALSILKSDKKQLYGVASYILGRLKYETARLRIEEVVKDKSLIERDIIAESLGWIGNKDSANVLIEVLNEKEGVARYGAAWSLGMLQNPIAIEALMEATKSSDGKLAILSIESLGHFNDEKVLDFLFQSIEKNKAIALYAIPSMGNSSSPKLLKYLESLAEREEPEIYRPAIEQIGKLKKKDSITFLVGLLKKNNTDRNKILISALNVITGEKFFTSSEWINWYNKNNN